MWMLADGAKSGISGKHVAGRIGPNPNPGTVEEFAGELKRLVHRGAGGRLKVSALAKRVDISQSTLYAYLAGTTLPPTHVLDAILGEVGAGPDDVRRMATARDALGQRRRSTGTGAPAVVPRELPLKPSGFTGRIAELARLDTALGAGSGPPVVSVSGTAGVGKTALALHWCHRVAEEFPDGSLYVDLLGFSAGTPRSPGDALSSMLRSLGVTEVPEEVDARSGLLRSLLSGRRMLVLLDNALDAEQVRPLLPGAHSCLVVVTSRAELTGLQVHPGALALVLHPLSDDDAVQLLSGSSALDDPATVAALLARCAGLPLALRIVAARASAFPVAGLGPVAADLLVHDGLDGFEIGDAATSVRTVFSWSERHLDTAEGRLFRLLGLLPTKHADLETVAALNGCDLQLTRRHLGGLARAHLLETVESRIGSDRASAPLRFGLHDLLHEHAREQAAEHLSAAERTAALTGMVEQLVDTCRRAMEELHTNWAQESGARSADPAAHGSDRFPTADDAQAWLRREWNNLVTVLELSASQGWTDHTRDLSDLLRRHLDQGGRHRDAANVLGHLLTSCRTAGDVAGEATALRDLGVAAMRLGEHDAAMRHFDDALSAARRTGDPGLEAAALNNLGNLHERLGDHTLARSCYEQALAQAVEAGIRGGEATLHNNIAVTHNHTGDPAAAVEHCRLSLAIFEEIGDLGGQARALGNLGEAHRHAAAYDISLARLDEALALARRIDAGGIEVEVLNALGETRTAVGDVAGAIEHHQRALAGARMIGDPYEEARASEGVGHAHASAGRLDEAADNWRRAQQIFLDLGLAEARRMAVLLSHDERDLDATATRS